jgi:uroporphyrinogen decarboxylase
MEEKEPMDTMTPLQRFKIEATLGKPDQVPVMPFATGHYLAWFGGLDQKDYWTDPIKRLKVQLKFQNEFPEVMLYPGIWPDYGTAVEPSAFGVKIDWPQNSPAMIHPIDTKNIEEPADPWKDGLMPKALEDYEYILKNMPSHYKETYEYLDGWAISLGPIDIAALSVGYNVLFDKFYTDPKEVHRLLKITTETVLRYVKAQEKIGGRLKRYIIADDSSGLMSLQHFKEFVVPSMKKIFTTFSYAIGIFHCDSNTSHLLESIPEIGMDIFNFGPEVNIKEIKDKIGDKICLFGNIPPISIPKIPISNTLQKGTVEDVDRICKRLIKIGKTDGGYMLTTGSGMAAGTPLENIHAMIKAGIKYGRY